MLLAASLLHSPCSSLTSYAAPIEEPSPSPSEWLPPMPRPSLPLLLHLTLLPRYWTHISTYGRLPKAAENYPYFRGQEPSIPGDSDFLLKGLSLHISEISEIEELCECYSSTIVLLDHMGFCKPPLTDEEHNTLSSLLKLSRFPQVYVKFSALFRLSRNQYPYEDTRDILSKVISSFGANHVMWGSDFPFVVNECGYKEAKEAVPLIANHIPLSSADMEWIMGRTLRQLFHHHQ